MNAYILLNQHANNGKALLKWNAVKDTLFEYYAARDCPLTIVHSRHHLKKMLHTNQGERTLLIAAGGDGTVNYALNTMMQNELREQVILGAIGLGSSNDFHKPFHPKRMLNSIPARINPKRVQKIDVGRATFLDELETRIVRYFLINSSIGLTAEGNLLFNSNDVVINFLKSKNVTLTILVSFLKSLVRHKNIAARLTFDKENTYTTAVTNLGILKNPHFTGNLRYDTLIQPDDGKLGINLIEHANIVDQLKLFYLLQKGRFSGLPNTKSWVSQQVRIDVDSVVALETDGEVFQATAIEYSILPRSLYAIT